MPAEQYNPLIDANDLRVQLGVSQATIERWVAAKIIPSYKFGSRCVRFDYAQVRSALSKFEIPAYRRLPRGPFAHRRKPSQKAIILIQTDLALIWEDPAQLLLPLSDFNPTSFKP